MKSILASKSSPFLTLALILASVSSAPADVVLSKLFGDHMVLQQNQPIRTEFDHAGSGLMAAQKSPNFPFSLLRLTESCHKK